MDIIESLGNLIGNSVGHFITGAFVGVLGTMAQAFALTPDMQTAMLTACLVGAFGFFKGIVEALPKPKDTQVAPKKFTSYFGF